ncbi:cryptochrome/photolyase family protein [Derxia gummosa]|uniref:Cryptochrome/photolyase family protein n=1 Tax=Derxia gummosa DSM 723 TaxID=1121388 RepID=A0A8B6X8N5_9BURK|nr:cryptochrome/photolyase family protein [Derxia gummosa]
MATDTAVGATPPRRLALVLGDQLWAGNPALDGLDPTRDAVLMIEARGEASGVWSHKARIAVFLSAMRHFRDELRARGWTVHYLALGETVERWAASASASASAGEPESAPRADALPGFAARLADALAHLRPAALTCCEPGEWRMLALVQDVCARAGIALDLRDDTHFLCSRADFARWTEGRREWRMELFYREQRRRLGILMDGDAPAGGRWNFDTENRKGWGRHGPGLIPPPARFEPDAVTREVIALVEREFADHPGSLAGFGWAVTRADALIALAEFIDARLEQFGPWQDAMWTGTPFGWHSLLSVALNLRLLDPREVIAAAETAWRERGLPLASVEGFIRQIAGWREFIRGVYWQLMPGLADANHYRHDRPLPHWYWTGETRMACMRAAIGQTLEHGYAHHIQRLMVTGQFALTAGIRPREVSDWYLAVYVDAVEWVEVPNVIGMALHADGGRFTSKPYVASGAYIKRMSNYCDGCAYAPERRHGDGACPVTTFYWAFVDRHEAALRRNPRTQPMTLGLARLGDDERAAFRAHAAALGNRLDEL